ncbi:MAG TPA: hypothetical protein VJ731_17135 [Terriglobales bacterium]|nr:hypothetical protein [Terriglobales bacterium]
MAEPGLNTDSVLQQTIGEPGTHLRRIKEKTVRADLTSFLEKQPNALTPELRLRAYLAIGRVPEPGLLTFQILRRALSSSDCASFASLLTTRHILIDADAVLSALEAFVRSDRTIRVERIAGTLARTVRRWRGDEGRLALDSASLRAYIDVVLALLEKARESQSRSRTKRDMVLVRLVVFAIVDTANVGTSALQFHALKLLMAAYNVIDSELSDALDELEDFRSAYDSIVRGTTEQLRRMATSGKSDEFETTARNLLRSKITEKQTRQVLQALYTDRGQLDGSIQGVLANLLGMGRAEQPAEPDFEAGNTPSVQSVQLASALIRSWNAARDSHRSHEAFDELASVLRNFFDIQIKGEPGEIVEFNPLVHELPPTHGSKPSHVRIIRPRVETLDSPVARILIKALVEPA